MRDSVPPQQAAAVARRPLLRRSLAGLAGAAALGVLGADPRPANTTPADPGAGVLVAPDPIKEAIPKSGLAIELVELVRAPRSALVASPSRRVDLRFGQGQAGDVYVMSKRDGWIRRMQAVPCGTFRCDIDGLRYIASYPDLILAFGANAAAGQSHFTTYGQFEGRNPNVFHVVRYLARYPDLQAAFASDVRAATVHYIQHGYFEGRTVA